MPSRSNQSSKITPHQRLKDIQILLDILVSNIRLPKQEGTWLIQQIRNHPYPGIRSLPAIGITSYDRETSAQRALDAGFDCFLSKLDSLDALVGAIYRLIR